MREVNPVNARRVGIRELKARLSECVREVKQGATIVVTEHGRGVARLVPETDSVDDRLDGLKASGAILWSGRHLGKAAATVRTRGARTVASIVVENRE